MCTTANINVFQIRSAIHVPYMTTVM